MPTETLLVVDDDPEIIKILRDYLEAEDYQVITAESGKKAIQHIYDDRPDCVILDVMLPDQDGWSVVRKVRSDEKVCMIPIILLTARVDDIDKINGLELGADDYITKPFNPREVVARVRVQLRHSQRSESRTTSWDINGLNIDKAKRRLILEDKEIELTATEFDILCTFMEHPGYVFTRDELIEEAFGYSFAGLGRTIDSHIKNLRQKIEIDPKNPQYILTVYGVGYRFAEADT